MLDRETARPRRGCRSRAALRIGCAAWLAASALAAQPAQKVEVQLDENPAQPGGVFDPSSFRTLLSETGCAVRYRDALDRAHHVLRRLEVLSFHFRRWARAPVPTAVWLADRAMWRESGILVDFGLPVRTGQSSILVPAAGDAGTVALWRGWLGKDGLPDLPGSPLVGTGAEVATLVVADDLLQLEAARGFVRRVGLFGGEVWAGELVAHVVAQSLVRRYEPERVAGFLDLFSILERRFAPGWPLDRFAPQLSGASAAAEVERWLWFQGRFADAARRVLDRGGRDTVEEILQAQRKGKGRPLGNELLRRYPDLGEWLDSFPSAGPG